MTNLPNHIVRVPCIAYAVSGQNSDLVRYWRSTVDTVEVPCDENRYPFNVSAWQDHAAYLRRTSRLVPSPTLYIVERVIIQDDEQMPHFGDVLVFPGSSRVAFYVNETWLSPDLDARGRPVLPRELRRLLFVDDFLPYYDTGCLVPLEPNVIQRHDIMSELDIDELWSHIMHGFGKVKLIKFNVPRVLAETNTTDLLARINKAVAMTDNYRVVNGYLTCDIEIC